MTDAELLDLAVAMRRAQRDYYRGGRTADALRRSLDLEHRFDREVRDRGAGPRRPSLFGDGEAPR